MDCDKKLAADVSGVLNLIVETVCLHENHEMVTKDQKKSQSET